MQLMADVLSQQKDNIALIDRVIQKQDDLFDNKERLARVENFFKSQVTVFDAAARMEGDLRIELDYLSRSAAGIRGRSLIINLPGSQKASAENLLAVIDPVTHGLDMLYSEGSADCGNG